MYIWILIENASKTNESTYVNGAIKEGKINFNGKFSAKNNPLPHWTFFHVLAKIQLY